MIDLIQTKVKLELNWVNSSVDIFDQILIVHAWSNHVNFSLSFSIMNIPCVTQLNSVGEWGLRDQQLIERRHGSKGGVCVAPLASLVR